MNSFFNKFAAKDQLQQQAKNSLKKVPPSSFVTKAALINGH